MLKANEISVVIQGLYNPEITPVCLKSIKKHLPNAEVILSLSEQPEKTVATDGIDKLIVSEKSPIFPYSSEQNAPKNTVNPQIVSTVAGLKAATRPYTLKIRTDFALKSDNFLKYFDDCPMSDPGHKIFDHKIIDCSYFARHPERSRYLAYHPSDIALFGKTSDLLNLFDVPLMTENESGYWKKEDISYCRYTPEQHIFINCLRKNGKKIDYDHTEESITRENIIETEKYFASNFIFLGYNRFGLVPPDKFWDFSKNNYYNTITYIEGLLLYQRHVDPAYPVPKKDNERRFINKSYKKKRFLRIIARFCALPFFGRKNKQRRHVIRQKVLDFFINKQKKDLL